MGKTPQEEFWAGDFGNSYTDRNKGQILLASRHALFSRILSRTRNIASVMEFGANQGLNLIALKNLLPFAEFSGLEINARAATHMQDLGFIKTYQQSIIDFVVDYQRDLVISKGLLIHINPDKLDKVYDVLYSSSRRYILLSEYYNPTPLEIVYRGSNGKLFKRDFAGEMLDRYPDLQLLDYGFVYHRDSNFPMDDNNWFILEKK